MTIPSGGISSFEAFIYMKELNKTFFDISDILQDKNLSGFSHEILREFYNDDMFIGSTYLNVAKYVEVSIYQMLSE